METDEQLRYTFIHFGPRSLVWAHVSTHPKLELFDNVKELDVKVRLVLELHLVSTT